MMEKHFILATAGHVDHGKSALVKALTGTDPDRLPEEKARGITIDLGFAELNLGAPNGERFHIGIVDVPGHEDFVRNMIAGVGSIDLALLTVAADDGWMPQTEEHFQILNYLGVQHIVVALTKSDLGKIANVTAEIREKLRETAFANAQIIPTSARTGAGLEDLKQALACEFATLSPPRDIEKPRLFVDRAFTLRGIGTVVTGTLTGGQVRRGQSVVVQPQNFSARVRSIQSHGRDVEMARPGTRTAINLPDVPIGADGIKRGDAITIVDLGEATDSIAVLLEKSSRLNRDSPAARPFKNRSSVHIHFGTTRVGAKITLLDQDAIECGQRAIAQLRLDAPILAFVGDRFVIRDSSEQNTIAGGTVLDPDGNRESFRSSAQIEFLRARATAPNDVAKPAFGGQLLPLKDNPSRVTTIQRSWAIQPVDPTGCPSGTKWIDLCIRSQLERDSFAETGSLLIKSNFGADQIVDALTRLERDGQIVLRGEIATNAAHWRDLVARATVLIDRQHEKHPEQRGLDLTKLRAELNIRSDELFSALVLGLVANDFVRHENLIARNSHRPSLPPEILPVAEKIRAALAAKPFDPPDRGTLTEDRHAKEALRFLIERGDMVELNSEVVLLRDAAKQMRSTVVGLISDHGPATASQLRQKIGTSRRVIIPFLEYLDRVGVTQRIGDSRQLRETKSATIARR